MAAEAGLAGLEFLSGIPGTIGGALRMNAGAHGREMADIVEEAHAVGPDGQRLVFTPAELGFTYRKSGVADGVIFTGAVLAGEPDDVAAIRGRMDEIARHREATQPIRDRTGGSTFKNPPGASAWKLIDAAGCRGLRVGGGHGVGDALQFSDQCCRRQRRRHRDAGRDRAPTRCWRAPAWCWNGRSNGSGYRSRSR